MDKDRDIYLGTLVHGSQVYEGYGALGEVCLLYDGNQCPCYAVSFSTWEGFGKLWKWAYEEKFTTKFGTTTLTEYIMRYNEFGHDLSKIDPDIFSNAVYEFLTKYGVENEINY
jgi:hypothetical protein